MVWEVGQPADPLVWSEEYSVGYNEVPAGYPTFSIAYLIYSTLPYVLRLSVCLSVCLDRSVRFLEFLVVRDIHAWPTFNKPCAYKSRGAWANGWDLYRCKPSRVGRGRHDALFLVAFLLCVSEWGEPCLIYLSNRFYVHWGYKSYKPGWWGMVW